jgi:paraquat-inducible protein A
MPWGMVEVFLLGLLVSMIKLNKLATLVPGWSLWSYIALIIVMTMMFAGLNPKDIWKRVPFTGRWRTPSYDQAHFTCHICHLTFAWDHAQGKRDERCPRCDVRVHYRKPKSLQRATALVIAAMLLYIPANVLPITKAVFLGTEQSDTIMSGIIFFMFSGSWHIALVIFMASVVIPFAKLLILSYLLFSVKYQVKTSPRVRTWLYYWTEIVGRWSMVDVYVVMVLVALVQLKPFAVIHAGPGVLYFAAVVVITMIAAESFDARLLWDQEESS